MAWSTLEVYAFMRIDAMSRFHGTLADMPQRAGTGESSDAVTLPIGSLDAAKVEKRVETDAGSIDRILAITDGGWDVDDQVATLQQAAATSGSPGETSVVSARAPSKVIRSSKAPPPLPRKTPPAPVKPQEPLTRSVADIVQRDGLIRLLQARVATFQASADKVGLSRLYIELAVASEVLLADDKKAAAWAQSALTTDPNCGPAHAILRRTGHGRTALAAMLDHLEHELVGASRDVDRIAFLSEKARLLEAVGARSDELRATWEQALALAPTHPAALKGLEAELVARTLASGSAQDWEALANHLGRMAEAYSSDAALAAWLHVERARILERKLDRVDAARSALEQAVALHPNAAPIREALVRHVASQGDWAALVRLLDEAARLEADGIRAARLELDAATIAASRLGDNMGARVLLERAESRAPTHPGVDRRVLDELIRLAESDARWADASRARRSRLRFVADPAALGYELRGLAAAAEREKDAEAAIVDVQRAMALDPGDPSLVDWLDRLLASASKHEQRVATWLQEAARAAEGERRARAFVRAARICVELGRRDDALRHLRSAWVASPGDPEALDGLGRLLAPSPPGSVDVGPRSLVELYTQAAAEAREPGRKAAYLERVALLWEETLGDPSRAAHAYEQVLAIDRDRQSAMIGLQRTATRAGDDRTLGRALLEEARVTSDREAQLALRTRAAAVIASYDSARAIQLVREVLDENPRHVGARELETRLYEEANRWELAAKSLRRRIDLATQPKEKVSLWIALAQTQHVRLRAPFEALASLDRARALDPSHPVPGEEAMRVLEAHGDPRALRELLEKLAASAQTPEERTRQLARAAEIDELRLGDDASAARTYQRALAETPDDDWLAERLARLIARRARKRGGGDLAELAALLTKRIDRAPSEDAKRALSFELASLLVEAGQEPMRATALLESVLAEQSDHVPALRTLEWLRRRATVDVASLARVLARQASVFRDTRARLGALWNLAGLEEWVLPTGDPSGTYQAILELDAADPSALDATFRRELSPARRGDSRAKKAALSALRALASPGSNDEARIARGLRLALLLELASEETADGPTAETMRREALEWYRAALRADDQSPTAATGVARLAHGLADSEAAFSAAIALAEMADDTRVRARCLIDAAELLLGLDPDARLGTRAERRQRATALLERALQADPDSVPAAGRLATVLLEDSRAERLLTAFREALGRAKSPEAVVMLGSEVARVARGELRDLPAAIDAMRRVRATLPQHVPSLLTLAELCIAQRVWPEAVDALESVVSIARDVPPRLTALFALASIYEKVLARPPDVDRVLRAAIAIDPGNVRALRALLRRMATEPFGQDPDAVRSRRLEMSNLLGRLAEAESDPDTRSSLFMELAEVQLRLEEPNAARRSLLAAVACAPANNRAFTRLGALFRSNPSEYSRALKEVIALGEKLGQVSGRWFAALGQAEVGALDMPRDGIAHLERAVDLDPTLYDARFELAATYARTGAYKEAARVLDAMLVPTPHPLLSIAEPARGLALLEQSLSAEQRGEEAIVVSELRALAGDLDDGRRVWLRARRLPANATMNGSLDRATMVMHVLPPEGRHVLLEVAAAIAGAETKMLRSDLTSLAISARDRIASRSGHPTRLLLDRVLRQLGVSGVELIVARGVNAARVLTHDVPWIVVPSQFGELPEPVQLVALGRAVARIAFGVAWLLELSPAHIGALLVAAARQVVRDYAPSSQDDKLVDSYAASLERVITRRQRKLLEELIPHLASAQSAPPPIPDFVDALVRAELRTAFVISGDLQAIIDDVSSADSALRQAVTAGGSPQTLATVLHHAWIGDVARYALSPAATALRRRLGATWSGS